MKKLLFALVIGGVVFSAAYAAAASLGLTSDGLGAGDSWVVSCADGINVEYTTKFNFTADALGTAPRYDLNEVVLTGDMSNCENQEYKVSVFDSNNEELSTESGTVTGASATEWRVTFSDVVRAQDITHVAVVITGNYNPAP